MNKQQAQTDTKVANAIEAAVWIARVWPKSRFGKWLMRTFLFPNAARDTFEREMQTLLSLPSEDVDAVIKRLRIRGKAAVGREEVDNRVLAHDFVEKCHQWVEDPSPKNREAMVRAEVAYALSADAHSRVAAPQARVNRAG